jgi:cytosine deaminase
VRAAPGTAELLEEAMKLGVENIGGLDPAAIDGDVEGQLDLLFGLAERFGAGIDIHLHDAGELGIYELEQIAARCKASGLNGRVTVSHAYALGMVSPSAAAAAASRLADAGVAIEMDVRADPGAHRPAARTAGAGPPECPMGADVRHKES